MCVAALDALSQPHSTAGEAPPHIFEWPLRDHSLGAVVIPVVACAHFPTTIPTSTQLSMNILGHSSPWTASFLSDDLLRLRGGCLHHCQASSIPHDMKPTEPD